MKRSERQIIIPILLPIFILLVVPPEIFPQQEYIEIPITLVVEERVAGEVPARIVFPSGPGTSEAAGSSPEKLYLRKSEVYSILSSRLNPETREILRKEDTGEYLSLADIEETGLGISYDDALLAVTVTIPPELRPLNVLILRDRELPVDPADITVALFSAYLNYRVSGGLQHQNYGTESETEFPLMISLMPGFQLFRWILESSMSLRTPQEGVDEIFSLNQLRLFRDFPKTALRFEAGTIAAAAGSIYGMQLKHVPLPGAPWKQPVQELSDGQTIILTEPAAMTVFLNDAPIRQERLEPGIHTLSALPYTGGINTVRVEVSYADGKKEIYQSSRAFDARLLRPGSFTFSSYFGAPKISFEKPVMGGDIFYGLGRSVSAGLGLQSDFSSILATWDTILASPLGNFSLQIASIMEPEKAPLSRAAIYYRLLLPGVTRGPVIGASYAWQDSAFRPSLLMPPGTSREHSLSLSLGLPLPLSLYVSTGASLEFDTPFTNPSMKASATLLSRIGDSGSLNFSNSFQYAPLTGGLQWSGSVTLAISPPGKRGGSTYSQNLVDGTGSFHVHGSGADEEAPAWSAGLGGYPLGEENTEVSATLGGKTEFFNWSSGANLRLFNDPAVRSLYSGGISASISGSLLFAGGLFGLAGPMEGSFVLIRPDENLEERLLSVRGSSISGAREKRSSTIVIPSLPPWKSSTLFFNLPEAPPDEVLEEERVVILSVEKGGSVIRPRLQKSYYGSGTLVDLDGKPLPLIGAEILPLDNPEEEGELVFSDENGSFQFHHLEPGTFLITLISSGRGQAEFVLSTGLENPIELGNITLPLLEKRNEE